MRMHTPSATAVAALAVGLVIAVPGVQATAMSAPKAPAVTCAGLKATIVGSDKPDTLEGTSGRDVIAGLGGDDNIRGLGGNDVICGGDGADTIYGGEGNDLLYGETDSYLADAYGQFHRKGDLLNGGEGDDLMDLGADARQPTPEGTIVPDGVTFAGAPGAVTADFRANPTPVAVNGADSIVHSGAIRFVGTEFNDVVQGTEGADLIEGGSGDDQVWGNGGDDTISADASGDIVGTDMISGGGGDDRISSRVGADSLAGDSGSDTITSTSVNRLLVAGGTGADIVSLLLPGEAGFSITGGAGRNELRIGAHPDLALRPLLRIDQRKGKAAVSGAAPVKVTGAVRGFRKVTLPAYTRTVYRGSNAGEVIDAHRDWPVKVFARGGADVVTGSNKKDRIDGGRGFDIVYAKGGKDRCTAVEKRHSC